MDNNISIITTFSDQGYESYGKLFIDSCKKYLSPKIQLLIYKDNVTIQQEANIKVFDLEPNIPDLTTFKNRNSFRDESNIQFKHQSIRFSHKVYALYHAANNCKTRYLIWLDADTELYDYVTPEFFYKFLPEGKLVAYLGRGGLMFSECGFMMYDLENKSSKEFFNTFKWYYDSDELYNLPEQHDSFIFDVVRQKMEEEGKIITNNVSANFNKHHFNAALDGYIMHLKGDRKNKRGKMMEKAMRRKGELAKARPPW